MAVDNIGIKPFAVPISELDKAVGTLSANMSAVGDVDEKTKKAARDFESIFINYMLKTMRQSISKSGLLDGGNAEEIYTAMMDEELSKVVSQRGGIGLSSILLKEFGVDKSPDGFKDEILKLNDIRPSLFEPETKRDINGDEPVQSLKFMSPVTTTGVVSSKYGYRHDPFNEDMRFHHGIDIAAKEGTSVYPAASGVVTFSGWKEGYGNMVEIRHANGYVTRYGHNARNLVKEGDSVDLNTPIAEVGSTGKSTGPHLHFEIRKNGVTQNPSDFVSIG